MKREGGGCATGRSAGVRRAFFLVIPVLFFCHSSSFMSSPSFSCHPREYGEPAARTTLGSRLRGREKSILLCHPRPLFLSSPSFFVISVLFFCHPRENGEPEPCTALGSRLRGNEKRSRAGMRSAFFFCYLRPLFMSSP